MSCAIEGCTLPRIGKRTWCSRHFRRWKAHGDPLGGRVSPGVPLAFLEQAVITQTDECIIWPYSLRAGLAGKLYFNGKLRPAPAVALELSGQYRPTSRHVVAHQPLICHQPACVNVRHLRWATIAENAWDKELDGTLLRGEAVAQSKLTADEVAAIRKRYAAGSISQLAIASEYGVTKAQVGSIVRGSAWAHLPVIERDSSASTSYVTHCPQGHEYTAANTQRTTTASKATGKPVTKRQCRECKRLYNARTRAAS